MSENPELVWAQAPKPLTVEQVEAAAAAVLGDGATGMVSDPATHTLVRLDEGRLVAAGGPPPLDLAFGIRLFTPTAELRWVHTGERRGAAVVLGETAVGPAGWPVERVEVVDVLDSRYALWGRRFEPTGSGWCRAAEGRIGWLDVPAPVPAASPPDQDWPGQYLSLRTREYVICDDDGNAEVFDERLVGLVVAAPNLGGTS